MFQQEEEEKEEKEVEVAGMRGKWMAVADKPGANPKETQTEMQSVMNQSLKE